MNFFGLWRICFPPVLVRTGRRLPVQALGERGVLVSLTLVRPGRRLPVQGLSEGSLGFRDRDKGHTVRAGLKRLGLGTLAQAYGPMVKKNSVNFIDIF